ncbi:hypothetical protein DFH06DRAFT_1206070, partial [Mycena polygramma]
SRDHVRARTAHRLFLPTSTFRKTYVLNSCETTLGGRQLSWSTHRSMLSGLKVLAVALSLASSAAAQATTLPQCALGCAKTYAIQAGCNLSDTTCLCKTSFSADVVKCSTTTSCSQAEQAQVGVILTTMCGAGSQSASASASAPVSSSSSPSSSGVPPSTSGSASASTSIPASATSTAPPVSSSGPPGSSSSPSIPTSTSPSASASPSSTGSAQALPAPARPAVGIAAAVFIAMWIC